MKTYKKRRIETECMEIVGEYIDERISSLRDGLDDYTRMAEEHREEGDDPTWYENQCEEIQVRIDYYEAMIKKLVGEK